MAKFCLKKQSKRQPARQRYKIEKRVRDHNKKARREAKKHPKSKKQPIIQIPNICPFKEDILKKVEILKKQKEDEKLKQRELARVERKKTKDSEKSSSLEGMVAKAEARGVLHDTLQPNVEETANLNKNQENSLKAYYKEFRKVIESADVILEVVDSRDPLGTRCVQVEEAVRNAPGNKRLVVVLNKADLIPCEILNKWLKYLRKSTPAVAFKASTQNQSRKLGQKKFKNAKNNDKILQGSSSVGTELLMSILANYCRNKGIKTSIRVGVVGLPNVGKSSLINSLKRSRACNVGATPGVTKSMQEVQLDSKIKLLDSPGIVFATGNDSIASLRNAVKVTSLSDPITPANAILQRVSKPQMMEMYDISEYKTPDEFYAFKAARTGRFKKGGVPDTIAAARGLLQDWNSGKIKYYTNPPEIDETATHVSASIVSEIAKEFDIEQFETMETDVFTQLEKENKGRKATHAVESLGPVQGDIQDDMEDDDIDEEENDNELLSEKVSVVKSILKKGKGGKSARTKKVDPEMQLEGNLQLNQVKKLQFKKLKKQENRREKVALQLSVGLENFSLQSGDDNYSFATDFGMAE